MLAAHQPEPALDRRLPFLRRIILKDYKSIGNAAIELEALTVLVGRNGSGKSNFLDALRFVAEGLQVSLDHAVKSRAGVDEIRRRGAPRSFSIELQLEFPGGGSAVYHLVIDGSAGSFEVDCEVLKISSKAGDRVGHYEVRDGKISRASIANPPPAQTDRLYLVTASGLPEFRPVYDALASVSFYDLDPEAMRTLQAPDSGDLLRRNGSNIASVVGRLRADQPETLERIAQYLAVIVPGLVDVERVSLGPRETLKFKQLTGELASPQEFFAWGMSDGTLRVLGTPGRGLSVCGSEDARPPRRHRRARDLPSSRGVRRLDGLSPRSLYVHTSPPHQPQPRFARPRRSGDREHSFRGSRRGRHQDRADRQGQPEGHPRSPLFARRAAQDGSAREPDSGDLERQERELEKA